MSIHFKIQLVQELKPHDHRLVNGPLIPIFISFILFSDEAHFWLNEYVNKQNCRIWSDPEKPTVWYALWTSGIIGPYFLKNSTAQNVTVNGDRYRTIIADFIVL